MKLKYMIFVTLFLSISILIAVPLQEEDFTVEAGSTYNHDISTDTGDIIIFEGARVKGDLESNSGDIYLEAGARVQKITSLNGDVFLEEGATVDNNISVTYGSLRVKSNCTLNGDVITESGDIRINGSYLKKSIETRHGDIILKDNTYVKEDIIILDRGNAADLQPLEIYLGTGVEIKGDIQAEDVDDLVVLEIYGAEVKGDIDNVSMANEDDEDDEDEEDQGDEDCGGRPEWASSVKYNKNDEVRYEGNAYKASKKTKGYEPSSSNKKNPWQFLGACD